MNTKFTTIFFIHLKCYANTHAVIQRRKRDGCERGKERGRTCAREGRRGERDVKTYSESNICGT